MESLKTIAAKMTALYLTNHSQHTIETLPIDIQFHIALYLKKLHLVNFIKCHKTIQNLKTLFSIYQFQMFIFHVIKQTEKTKYIPLENLYIDFKFESETLAFKAMYKSVLCDINYTISSLGLPKSYQVLSYIISYNANVMELAMHTKFNKITLYNRFPIPQTFEKYDCIFELPQNYPTKIQDKKHILKQSKHVQTTFFIYLTAMFDKMNKKSFAEALFYIIDVLNENNYLQYPFLSKYYIHLYGNLAIILSSLNMNNVLINTCIYNMQDVTFFLSDQLDFAFYKQTIYSIQYKYNQANDMFDYIFKTAPQESMFYKNSLILHLETYIEKFENWLLLINNLQKNDRYRCENHEKVQDMCDLFEKDYNYLMKILHTVFSKGNDNYTKEYLYFEILNVFRLAFCYIDDNENNVFDNASSKFEAMYKSLKFENHPLNYFFKLFAEIGSYTWYDFLHDFERERKRIELETHVKNSLPWAKFCFTYLCLHVTFQLENNVLFKTEALHFYKKINHVRYSLITNSPITQTESSQGVLPLNVEMLYKYEPNLKNLYNFGIETALLFDQFCF